MKRFSMGAIQWTFLLTNWILFSWSLSSHSPHLPFMPSLFHSSLVSASLSVLDSLSFVVNVSYSAIFSALSLCDGPGVKRRNGDM